MPADSADVAELEAIEQAEANAEARRAAIAAKWGDGAVVLRKPGDPTGFIVQKGRLVEFKVNYLAGGPST